MLIKHPTKPGWLIATLEIKRLSTAGYMIGTPDGALHHPLAFHEPDIIDKNEAAGFLTNSILAALESAFWQFAKQFTGEPEITQLKLKNWGDKYALAQHWAAAGQPDVNKEPELYSPVILEAGKRVNLTGPNELIASWLKNGYVWERLLNWYYQEYEPAERGRAYAAQAQGDIEALQKISEGLAERLAQAALKFLAQ